MWKEEKNVTSPWQSCQFALRSYWWKQAHIYDKEGKKSHVSENNRNGAKQRKAKTTSMERWSIFAELLAISRSRTNRDCWWWWRSGVHAITVCATREISTGGKSALWTSTHPSKAVVHIPYILLILACPSSAHCAAVWLISLFTSLKRSALVSVCHCVINMMAMC